MKFGRCKINGLRVGDFEVRRDQAGVEILADVILTDPEDFEVARRKSKVRIPAATGMLRAEEKALPEALGTLLRHLEVALGKQFFHDVSIGINKAETDKVLGIGMPGPPEEDLKPKD